MPKNSAMTLPGEDLDFSFFANIFHDSAVPSVIIAADGTVLFWNVAAEHVFGWSSEEFVGQL